MAAMAAKASESWGVLSKEALMQHQQQVRDAPVKSPSQGRLVTARPSLGHHACSACLYT